MKKYKKLFILSASTLPFLIISSSCNKKTTEEEKIANIVNITPYFKIRPMIFLPEENKNLSDYTAEALDCMRYIRGSEIIDLSNNEKIVSDVIEVRQEIGDTKATIKTLWHYKNSPKEKGYIKVFQIDGFKVIPLNHQHYVRTAKQPCKECLLKYNGN